MSTVGIVEEESVLPIVSNWKPTNHTLTYISPETPWLLLLTASILAFLYSFLKR